MNSTMVLKNPMPELAAIFFLGTIVGLIETALFFFLWKRRVNGPEFTSIRHNLSKVNLYWSESRDRLGPLSETDATDDSRTSIRTILITGVLLSLFSWAGAFFFGLVMVSYRFFARSRLEKRLFDSPLASNPDLDANEVSRIVSDIQS
jgi:hypothetical protein